MTSWEVLVLHPFFATIWSPLLPPTAKTSTSSAKKEILSCTRYKSHVNTTRVYLAQLPIGAILSTPADAPNFKPSEGGVNDGICGPKWGERGFAQFGFVVIEWSFDSICYNSHFVVRVRSYGRLKLLLVFIDFSAATSGRNLSLPLRTPNTN